MAEARPIPDCTALAENSPVGCWLPNYDVEKTQCTLFATPFLKRRLRRLSEHGKTDSELQLSLDGERTHRQI